MLLAIVLCTNKVLTRKVHRFAFRQHNYPGPIPSLLRNFKFPVPFKCAFPKSVEFEKFKSEQVRASADRMGFLLPNCPRQLRVRHYNPNCANAPPHPEDPPHLNMHYISPIWQTVFVQTSKLTESMTSILVKQSEQIRHQNSNWANAPHPPPVVYYVFLKFGHLYLSRSSEFISVKKPLDFGPSGMDTC